MERNIKSKGKYNLNFIDWNNEYDAIASSTYNWNHEDNECTLIN